MFRFSIRALMLVTLVAGLVVGWWADHRQQSQAIEAGNAWRHRARAIEGILVYDGLTVTWQENQVGIEDGDHISSRRADLKEPSAIVGHRRPWFKTLRALLEALPPRMVR
jgi:hypothetical protein